ncbi:MAG: hypothetical protein DRP30_01395 [Thermotoga sp.]|nr:MAG: hypothetical protein DRP30_01395 [Thermotoga sp.]
MGSFDRWNDHSNSPNNNSLPHPAEMVHKGIDCGGVEGMKIGVYSGNGTANESLKKIMDLLKENFDHVVDFKDEIPETDVLIIPGGRASEISNSLGKGNLQMLKSLVKDGARYIGICAGAYLAIGGYWEDTTLTGEIVLVETNHPDIWNWKRGKGFVRIRLHDHPIASGMREVRMWYENGPIFSKGKYDVIGEFLDDVNECGSSISMRKSPAIITAKYGFGDVVLFSPHPELSEEQAQKLLFNAIIFQGGKVCSSMRKI